MLVLAVGLGSIGRRHLENISRLRPDAELVVCSRSASPGQLQNGRPFRVVESLSAAIQQGPDLAVVSSATHLHARAMLKLIEAGTPMYVEKPVVGDRSQLDAVEAAVARNSYNAPSMVGCNLRHLPSLIRAREVFRSGVIGRVVRAHLECGQWLPDWRPGRPYLDSYSASPEQGGGVVLDLVHELDAARWFLGEFDRVSADLATRSSLGLRSEDVAGILLSREGGPMVTLALDYVARTPIRRYQFVGEQGTLTWNLISREVSIDRPGGERTQIGETVDFDVPATYVTAMSQFLDAVESGTPTSLPLSEGIRSMDLALKVKEAAGR